MPRLAQQTNRTLAFEAHSPSEGRFELKVWPKPGQDNFWLVATRWSLHGILEAIPTVWGLPRAQVEHQRLPDGGSLYRVHYAVPTSPWRPVLILGLLGGLLGFGVAWLLGGPLAWATVGGAAILLAIDGWRRVVRGREGRREDGQRVRELLQGADARYEALWGEQESLRRANLASRKLSGYLSGDLVERILANPELELSLGGRRTHAAVLFADIVGFTPRCEAMPPEQVVEELNLYFGHVDPVFVRHGGVIDKRIGDGVMVVFVPGEQDDLAQRAVSAGLDMLRAVEACNEELVAKGRQPLAIRVGVAQGPLVQRQHGLLGQARVHRHRRHREPGRPPGEQLPARAPAGPERAARGRGPDLGSAGGDGHHSSEGQVRDDRGQPARASRHYNAGMTTLIALIAACSDTPAAPKPSAPPAAPIEAPAARPAPLPPPLERAPQDPECMIQEALGLALAPLQEGVRVDQVNDVGFSRESFTFPDGTPVRYEHGGCVHYGMTLTVGLASKPADPFAEAVKQASRVEYAEDGDDLLTLLKAAGSVDEQGWFDCGDATCQVYVREEQGGVQLIVGYDFPL